MANSKTERLPDSDTSGAQGRYFFWLDVAIVANAWFVFERSVTNKSIFLSNALHSFCVQNLKNA